MYRVLPSLDGGSLEVTRTLPLMKLFKHTRTVPLMKLFKHTRTVPLMKLFKHTRTVPLIKLFNLGKISLLFSASSPD